MHGYKWELVQPVVEPVAADNDENQTDTADTSEHVFTFRDCMEAIFNGGKVRVTNETPKRVSVYDLIQVVTDSKNPRTDFANMCKDDDELIKSVYNWKFPGAGQRDTPVTTAEGALMIVNQLPGKRARKFRTTAMQTLVRFLAGDQSLHDEIDENAARQEQLTEAHPMRAFTEAANAIPVNSKFKLHSPSMQGKFISQFYGKLVAYLLEWVHEGVAYIKVGWSDNFADRIKDHISAMPGCTIWCIVPTNQARRVELAWKQDFNIYNQKLEYNSKTLTELFTGLTLEEAENRLSNLCEEQNIHDSVSLEVKRMEHESEMKKQETEIKKQEVELKRMEHDIEMKRLELQILQAQLALKNA